MITVLRLIGIGALVWLTYFTGTKLTKMAQIPGFISGPAPETKVITSKTILPGSYGDAYWLAWNDVGIRTPSRDRINLPRDVWQSYSRGDRIEVLYFAADPWPYHRMDIFAENGSFVFDAVLLAAWLAGIVTLSTLQIRHLFHCRGQVPPPLPSAYPQ
ncbi:MAG TPA: hypothetical protein VF614_00650 [Chthoniobacteraceae bacterium]|jgi:hypothetical protein